MESNGILKVNGMQFRLCPLCNIAILVRWYATHIVWHVSNRIGNQTQHTGRFL